MYLIVREGVRESRGPRTSERASEQASSCAHRLAIRENDAARMAGPVQRDAVARAISMPAQFICTPVPVAVLRDARDRSGIRAFTHGYAVTKKRELNVTPA